MAIMLQTGRFTDRMRLAKFMEGSAYSEDKFLKIINKYKLADAYKKFKRGL